MLKDIVVHVENTEEARARLEIAVALAREHEARLAGVGLEPPPPAALYVAGASAAAAPIAEQLAAEAQADLEAGKALFHEIAGDAGIETTWSEARGRSPAAAFAAHARFADLAVLGQTGAASRYVGLETDVALSAGRPALIVPYAGRREAVGRRVLVGWTPTREATRAVHDALPLLTRAEAVTVLEVVDGRDEPEPALDIVAHLRAHGVPAEYKRRSPVDDVGNELLNWAGDNVCDLLVMGLYGHTRIREMVFGGATRTVLEHLTLPVLVSH